MCDLTRSNSALGGNQRNHHLRHDRPAGALGGIDSRLEDCARLHLGDFRIGDGDAATAETEHRIEFGELAGARREFRRIGAHCRRDFRDFLLAMWQKLVQWRIEQPDRHRSSGHDLEHFDEVGALASAAIWRSPHDGRFLVVGENHPPHRLETVLIEKHVLGAAEPDALGAEIVPPLSHPLGVSALARTPSSANLVGPADQGGKFSGQLSASIRPRPCRPARGRSIRRP